MNNQFEPLDYQSVGHRIVIEKKDLIDSYLKQLNDMIVVCKALIHIINEEGCLYDQEDAVKIAERYLGINPENRS